MEIKVYRVILGKQSKEICNENVPRFRGRNPKKGKPFDKNIHVLKLTVEFIGACAQ